MAKLVWDQIGERYYETGVDHGVIYRYDEQTKTFKNGEAWNGLTAVNESPSGAEANPVYADNIKYLNLMSAEDFGAGIECFTYPDAFAECNGEASIADGVTIGQQTRKLFAFCYRTLRGNDTEGTDYGYIINIVYNCLASPSERSHSTVNDSPEAASLSFDISTTPVNVTGYKPTAILRIDSTTTDPDVLEDLKDILYGTADAEPRCPFPDEIVGIINGAQGATGATGN